MPKIKVKLTINNIIEEKQANIKNDTITYTEADNTKVSYSYKNNILKRENGDLKMVYNFDKGEGTISIKELDSKINVKIKTKSIKRKDNNIKVEYEIEKNTFKYGIEEIK